ANGTVYVATGGHEDSFIWGFDATNGDLRFQTPYGNQWSTWYAPVIQGDTLYMAGGYFGGMYAFSTIDGAQLWFHSLNQYDQFTPAVRGDRVFAYTGDYTPELTVVEAGTGTVIFEIPDPHFDWNGWSMNVSPVLGGLQNVLATQGGRLVSFDLVNRAIGYEISDHFQGNVTLASGVIYVRNGSAVNARAEATGSLQWTWAPPEGAPASTLIATKNILFASTGTTTYAVDVATHRQVWSYPAGGTLALTRSGPLLIAQSSGKLTAISLR
ncbi:MAG TPA: PQQ-binding-like beta-propeller repeat protein, partial [Gemmatimonadaceae bacterium]|nr:PQQ-binding-like beta-propeller repeat protein [Gemmatimonadaceae bacterium]